MDEHWVNPYVHADIDDLIGEECKADIEFWKVVPYWTVEEGVALSYGYDPRAVNLDFMEKSGFPFAKEFRGRLTIAVRAREQGELNERTSPADYIKWAQRLGLSFAVEVEQAVLNASKARRIAARSGEDDLNPKVKHSLQMMILGLAIVAYRYNPKAAHSSVPREISEDLTELGLSLSDDTVRNHLADAARELGDKLVGGNDKP